MLPELAPFLVKIGLDWPGSTFYMHMTSIKLPGHPQDLQIFNHIFYKFVIIFLFKDREWQIISSLCCFQNGLDLFVPLDHIIQFLDSLIISLCLWVCIQSHAVQVHSPGQNNVAVRISSAKLDAHQVWRRCKLCLLQVLERLDPSWHQKGRNLSRHGRKENTSSRMKLRGEPGEFGEVKKVGGGSWRWGQDTSWSEGCNVSQCSNVFVQEGSVRKQDCRNVSLWIDLIEISV